MMQKTDFPYELVISDDCSPDRTREIALELQRRYPDRIRLLLPETNLGMMPNFVQTLRACTGDYIALLEGDDYWIDARKLQKQRTCSTTTRNSRPVLLVPNCFIQMTRTS